ncbi:hypothetical protein yc1106_02178 [Curvularia clavata]|uniref:F-box domain-containing protein n=1 Tax=Curvularia clavata TaxID=95742 RepID=A0A9Q9DQP2_CURCL|nr:hypothetical protein yc1106_02178 [Curvularia clavata]
MAPSTPSNSRSRKRRVPSPNHASTTPPLPREITMRDAPPLCENRGLDHFTNAALGLDVETSRHRATCLLDLPSELIDLIASKLRKDSSVFSLAYVNKRLYGIVQETIVRELVLGRQHIKGFLELLGHHPDLIQKVAHVDLGDFGCSHHDDCHCLDSPNLDDDMKKTIGRMITANTQGRVNWSHIRKTKYMLGPVWGKDQAFFLNVLAALCTNIKSMTVELPEARRFQSGRPPQPLHLAPDNFPSLNPELFPVTPFGGVALEIFRRSLHTLTIAEDTRWKGPATLEVLHSRDLQWRNMGKHTITLVGFSGLRRLDVPMEALGCPQNIVFSNEMPDVTQQKDDKQKSRLVFKEGRMETLEEARLKVLPLSITHLHLRSCNKWAFAFLKTINEVPSKDLKLRYVELFFNSASQEAIIQCDASDEGKFSYLDLLTDLEHKNIEVRFFCGDKETPVDMRRELEALCFLTPYEAWQFSISRRPFSDLDSEASRNRQSSMIGSRLFLRHAGSHLSLLNSATFDSKSWAHSAFFRGTKPATKTNSTKDQKSKGSKSDDTSCSDRGCEKWKIKRRLPALLNLNNFEFNFHVDQTLSSVPKEAVFQGVVLPISSDAHTTCSEDDGSSKKTMGTGKEEASRIKISRRSKRADSHSSEVKTLENNMIELEIGFDCGMTSCGEAALKTSTFNIAAWLGIDWKASLKPPKTDN